MGNGKPTEHDEAQNRRIDAVETTNTGQDTAISNLQTGQRTQSAVDAGQNTRLEAVERQQESVSAELPGINTPRGAQQRIKLQVPGPATLMTLGAIGNNDAQQHPVGPGGFALKTAANFAGQIAQHTIIDTDHNIIIHTPENLTAVTGKKLNFSTNGDYQLGTKGGIDIAAASGAGFTDPAFTVDPQMAVPDPPAIDTKGPRSSTEKLSDVWGGIWKAYDVYSGATALKDVIKERSLSKGLAKGTFAGKAAGLYGIYNGLKKIYDGVMAAGGAAVAAFDHSNPSAKPAGPGKPKITMYSDDGVSILSPEKVAIFSSTGGVAIDSPHKVGMKGGVSASIKAGCDATVFAFVSAKLESKLVAAVKGKVVSVQGDLTEVIGKKMLHLNGKTEAALEADTTLRMSCKGKAELSAHEVYINSDYHVETLSDDFIGLHSKRQTSVFGDKKVYIKSDELIIMRVKNASYDCKESEIKIGCDDKIGFKATSSQANIGTQESYTVYKDSGFSMKGGGASKIKAPNIDIG